MNKNLEAFLRVIREGESSQDDDAYRTQVGGTLLDSLEKHPDKSVWIKAYAVNSTAAGAYQFLSRTWKEVAKALNLPDFSKESQDAAAIFLIKRRGAYDDVLSGRFQQAILKCNKEWASLPGSPYGQRTMSMARAMEVYEQFGGTYGMQEEGQETAQEVKENTMNPLFIGAALDALRAAIPAIKNVKGQQAAETIVGIAKEALGAKNEQEVIESLSNPESVHTVKTAVEARWFDLTEAGGGGIAGARKAAVEASDGLSGHLRNPAFIMSALLLPLVYGTVGAVLFMAGFPPDLKVMVVTAVVSGVLNAILGFWLGSSISSSRKTELLSRQ